MPPGLAPAPGPWLLVGSRYSGSPAGPYLELAAAQPARIGLRPGWCVQRMVVDSPAALVGGRLQWGLPKQLAHLRWRAEGAERELVWEEAGVTLRGRASGLPLPGLLPVRTLQRRGDGPVVVPGQVRGKARWSWVSLELDEAAPDGGPGGDSGGLAPLAGRHPGVVIAGMQLVIREARTPAGIVATIRAVEPVPTAAVWCGPAGPVTPAASLTRPGRMAQLVRAQPSHG